MLQRIWSSLKPPARIGLGLLVIAALTFGFLKFTEANPQMFARVNGQASTKIEGLHVPKATVRGDGPATLRPVYTPAQVQRENVGTWRHYTIPWNSQMGLIYANGGPETARGSIMAQYGLDVRIHRYDDFSAGLGELIKFARAFKAGERDPQVGAHSVVVMGDAGPYAMAVLQQQLDSLGLHARIIGAAGRSLGEDKCMGPASWADNPQKAKGGVMAGVLRDGDVHICLIWAQANGIPVNPDPKTWDPDALNFFATNSFSEADQAYIAGTCETRPVVKNGKGTGESRQVCVQGTATWTPGDVNVVRAKGGLVSLLSTQQNGAQMYATIIVIDEWARQNPATVTNFLKANLDGSAEVLNDRAKLTRAAGFAVDVWGEQTAAYWERYYYGRTEDDPTTGRQIRLGGSQALGLASNLEYFLPGSNGLSVYEMVYRTFGDLDRRLYPAEMPEYPRNVVNTSFLERIRAFVGNPGRGNTFGDFSGSESAQVAARSYSINFGANSATILPSSYEDLQQILANVTVASNLAIEVNGYASAEGDPDANQRLSEARAESVRQWLVRNAPAGLITPERVRVTGFGSAADKRLCQDFNEACHRRNRRVEIRLLSDGV